MAKQIVATKGDIFIYENIYRCADCEAGVKTHNPFHLPHYEFSFSFNQPEPEFDRSTFLTSSLVEIWEIEDLRKIMESPPEMEEFGIYNLSWTQLAIARCNELSR